MKVMFSIQCEKQNQYFMQSYNFFYFICRTFFSKFLDLQGFLISLFASFEKISRRFWSDIKD